MNSEILCKRDAVNALTDNAIVNRDREHRNEKSPENKKWHKLI